MHQPRPLLQKYRLLKPLLKKRLSEFKRAPSSGKEHLFSELCFCLLTPQSKARACDNAIQNLKQSRLLFSGTEEEIKKVLVASGVRFHHTKAKRIVEARKILGNNMIKTCLATDPFISRELIIKNVKGLGYKESSHFLRNIGHAEGLAILDRHILKNMKKYGAVTSLPKTLTRKKYLHLEKKMHGLSEKIGIPAAELDLVFWSEETGEVFK
ncbi:MAG TPA: N-glycosylase/DNA lyase [Candidatus Nanoarchaeia archaeon]|nr:N-glycosylase/DNA lyase [Candidatus Nanoarchaeia archaeon]